jgi:hypothetical protein
MSRYYLPLSTFLENDSEPLRKRILELLYLSIWDDGPNTSNDVTEYLLRAYEAQCKEDERNVPAKLEGSAACEFLYNLYVERAVLERKNRKLPTDADSVAEGFEWPEALPRDYPIRIGILKTVAFRMAAADAYSFEQLRNAMLADEPPFDVLTLGNPER